MRGCDMVEPDDLNNEPFESEQKKGELASEELRWK